MAKTVKVKTYKRKTKSGKIAVVKQHSKVDNRGKKSTTKSGAGSELKRKKEAQSYTVNAHIGTNEGGYYDTFEIKVTDHKDVGEVKQAIQKQIGANRTVAGINSIQKVKVKKQPIKVVKKKPAKLRKFVKPKNPIPDSEAKKLAKTKIDYKGDLWRKLSAYDKQRVIGFMKSPDYRVKLSNS